MKRLKSASRKRTTKPAAITALAKELGVTPSAVSQRRSKGQSDDEIRRRISERKAEKVERLAGRLETSADADRRNKIAIANMRELEEAERRGELVNAAEVRAAQLARATAERDAWLNWPARFAAEMAAEFGIPEQRFRMALDGRVREHLEERSRQQLPGV